MENVKVFGISPFSAAILRTFSKWGGASQAIFWGGQSRDIFRGGPVKKITLYQLSVSKGDMDESNNHKIDICIWKTDTFMYKSQKMCENVKLR